jgi:hypothetical protein
LIFSIISRRHFAVYALRRAIIDARHVSVLAITPPAVSRRWRCRAVMRRAATPALFRHAPDCHFRYYYFISAHCHYFFHYFIIFDYSIFHFIIITFVSYIISLFHY